VAQNPSIDGLTKWTQLDRSLVDRSLVVWHIFGLTHMPRPEDWPVMPVETCGFALKPCGFFASSPVMDLPLGNGHWGAAAGGAHGSVQTRSNCGGCT
jgi:primary-amine oxidase